MTVQLLVSSILFFLISLSAQAESYAECSIEKSSVTVSSPAPRYFELIETGKVTLYVQEARNKLAPRISIGVEGSSSFFYLNKSISLVGAATYEIEGVGSVTGLETFSVKACEDEQSTTATYQFVYRDGRKKIPTGVVQYKCVCGMD
jgi:hypothetical protein